MTEIVVKALLLGGSAFMLLAALGVTRMPDLYLRMSTVTKSATMGAGLLLLAIVVNDATISIVVKAAVLALFGFLTSPITGHLVTRAAYIQRVPLWGGTVVDELKGHYEAASHTLQSPASEEDLVIEGFLPEALQEEAAEPPDETPG